MSEWKTIDSAPKEPLTEWGHGPLILGWDGATISVTYWVNSWRQFRRRAEVTIDGYGYSYHDSWHPTHWQPLPEPPKEP